MIKFQHFKNDILSRDAMKVIVDRNSFNFDQNSLINECPNPGSALEKYNIGGSEIPQDGCDKPKGQFHTSIYNDSKSISVWLRAYRKNHKLSQLELSEIMDVRRATLADWERGASIPNSVNLEKIYILLGLNLSDILINSQHHLPKK